MKNTFAASSTPATLNDKDEDFSADLDSNFGMFLFGSFLQSLTFASVKKLLQRYDNQLWTDLFCSMTMLIVHLVTLSFLLIFQICEL